MVKNKTFPNAAHLQLDFSWFSKILDARFRNYFNSSKQDFNISQIPAPAFGKTTSLYAEFIEHYKLNPAERLILILSMVPHVQPNLLDIFFTKNETFNRGYTEFGGVKGEYHSGFLPTGETAMFILAGNNIEQRISFSQIFDREHFFYKHKILQLQQNNDSEPFLSGVLQLSDEYVDYFTSGKVRRPKFSLTFPAKPVDTKLDWEDVILEEHTKKQIMEILSWLEHGPTLLNDWGMNKRIMPGYRCLFHGPSGTGKTLTAGMIGKMTGREVYKVDLSMVISKYIGETEKNLAKIFDKAENKGWILFFDEADALFGKRTEVKDSHDRFANQEVSYLLQKVEDYDGLVILATNFKSNLDDAFARRFQSIIHFPMPKTEQRLQLWKNAIPTSAKLSPEIDLNQISNKYEMAGGSIMNIIRYAALMAVKNGDGIIHQHDLQEGIIREYRKEGKTF
ncbi:MAG TPA: ATP-binding protein [Bacteroidales bacterium]